MRSRLSFDMVRPISRVLMLLYHGTYQGCTLPGSNIIIILSIYNNLCSPTLDEIMQPIYNYSENGIDTVCNDLV